MRRAGQIVHLVLTRIREAIRPGISTAELDQIALRTIQEHHAEPSFLGYQVGSRRYPASTCISVNDVVVHGIPSPDTKLRSGDIVGVDVGAAYKGYHGDAAATMPVGVISSDASRLIAVTREALGRGIEAAVVGARVSAISRAVQTEVERNGFSVVRALTGHGIGKQMHEPPSVPNFVSPGPDPKFDCHMTVAIEPMVNAGGYDVKVDDDGWGMRTADGSLSAHFEHTVVITEQGAEVITLPEPLLWGSEMPKEP
jgi:methionyl aminopeptidase